jgi:hypothetical protein
MIRFARFILCQGTASAVPPEPLNNLGFSPWPFSKLFGRLSPAANKFLAKEDSGRAGLQASV